MIAERVLGSTAHTIRLTFLIVVLAGVLFVLIKTMPWEYVSQLFLRANK